MLEAGNLSMIALLGRRDEPTDALRDYCARLREGLRLQGAGLETAELLWDRSGWPMTIAKFWKQSKGWEGRWILLQYTALMWSRRGFPAIFLVLLAMLRFRKCRTAIVFHDVYAVAGP